MHTVCAIRLAAVLTNIAENYSIRLHYILNFNNPADMLTKDTGKGLDDPLWQHGLEILGNRQMWQIYKPNKANIDAIPVFCGNVAIGEYACKF